MKKNTIKIIVGVSAGVVGAGILIPGIVATVQKNNNYTKEQDNENLNFDGQSFSSKNDLINYALKNVKVFNNNISTPTKWSLRINGNEEFFNSPRDVETYLMSKIKESDVATSTPIDVTTSGEILPSELEKFSDIDAKNTTIYRGKNNAICSSLEQAKNTYLEIHDAYLFQNTYFRTKEELTVFLKKNSEWMQNAQINSIVLLSPSGFKSNPIDVQKIASNDAKTIKYLKTFIKQNAENYFSLDVDVGTGIDKKYYKDLSNPAINSSFDSTYTEVVSNRGKGNYIIDTDITDEATLYGPYYVQSSDSILGITNKDNWRKISGTDQKFFEETKNLNLISTFFNLILGVNSETDDGTIFNINKKLNVEIKNYFETLKTNCPDVYYSVNNIYTTMKKGKRYGEFYKLPILFVHSIDQMIYRGIPQKYIDLTREIYSKICKHYDEQLYSLIPENILIGIDKTKFSFIDVFGINKQNLDLNYDIESIVGIILDKYPDLFETIKFFDVIYANLNQTNNLVFVDEQNEININWLQEYTGLKLNSKFANEYVLMFNLLRSKNEKEVKEICKQINPQNDNVQSTFVMTNFMFNYGKDQIFKRIIEFFINPEKAIKKHQYDEYQIKVLKSLKFLEFSSDNGQYLGNDEITRNNHEFIRYLYNKYNGDVDVQTFTNLAVLQTSKPGFKFPESWKDLTLPELNDKIVGLLKMFMPQALKSIRFLWNKVNEIFACLNSNNLIHFLTVLLPNILDTLKQIVDFDFQYDFQWDLFDNIFATCKRTLYKTIDGLDDFGMKFDELLSTCESLFQAIPTFGVGISLVNGVIKFITNIHKTEAYSYVFENEDVKYIWNGGFEETWMFGLIDGNVTDLSSMKLLEPMQIIKPNINNGYYYNGAVYPNLDILKRIQINDILNNRYNSPKIKTVYAFENIDANNHLSSYYADDVNKLVDLIIDEIKKYSKNPNQNIKPPFITENDYLFANGIKYESNLGVDGNINKIIKDIKPVKIATLPNLKNDNTPISRDDNLEDNSLPQYKLPETSWNPQQKYVYNDSNNKYVIIDPNTKQNKNLSDNEILDKLKSEFYKTFDVDSKIVLENDLLNNNLFSNFSSNTEHRKIYWTKGRFSQTKIFNSQYDAIKWLLHNYDFKAYYETESFDTYIFENQQFNNIDEFLRWVLEKARGAENE